MQQLFNNFDQQLNNVTKFIDDHVYLNAIVTIFLGIYAGAFAPELPESISKMFDNNIFKIIILFFVAMTTKVAPHIALMVALGFFITLQGYERMKFDKKLNQITQYLKANWVNSQDNEQEQDQEQEQQDDQNQYQNDFDQQYLSADVDDYSLI